MAGVKGRSGGPRPNSGGARPGAGRPKKEPVYVDSQSLVTDDPNEWLRAVMKDPTVELKERKDAAKALLAHEARMAQAGGKKEERQKAASDVAAGGRFRPAAAPKLRAVN